MSLTASVLVLAFVAQAATQTTPPVTSAPGGTELIRSRPAGEPQSQPSGERDATEDEDRRHQFGLGATFGLSGRGGGGGLRFFPAERLGVNLVAGYSRPMTSGTAANRSVFYVAPSVVYMLTPMNLNADVDVRPYLGGGLSYGGASGTPATGGSTGVRGSGFGVGGQGFGGIELTFQDVKTVTISAEVAHYEVHAPYSAGPILRGTNFFLTFHFFLK